LVKSLASFLQYYVFHGVALTRDPLHILLYSSEHSCVI